MRVVRWILVLPWAVLLGMLGSLIGGIVATPFGQSAMDTSSALFGTFAFVFAAGVMAPSQRRKVAFVAFSIVCFLALLSLVLSMFTTIEEFAARPATEKVLIPIAQLLGCLYGWNIVSALVTEGSTLEYLWREITGLGATVCFLGLLIIVIGIVFGLFGFGWIGITSGVGVFGLGVLTCLFPIFHLKLRVRKMEQHMQEILDRKQEP